MSKDVTSFGELYEQYAEDVYRFSFWLCGDSDDAKDITSETFVRVWTSESAIRMESVKAYLFTISRNLYLQQKRAKNKLTPIAEEMPDTAIPADRLLETRMDLEQTLTALQTLPEIDRTMLIMRAQDDMPYEEIARATGFTLSAVKVKIFRARAKLSKLTSHLQGEHS